MERDLFPGAGTYISANKVLELAEQGEDLSNAVTFSYFPNLDKFPAGRMAVLPYHGRFIMFSGRKLVEEGMLKMVIMQKVFDVTYEDGYFYVDINGDMFEMSHLAEKLECHGVAPRMGIDCTKRSIAEVEAERLAELRGRRKETDSERTVGGQTSRVRQRLAQMLIAMGIAIPTGVLTDQGIRAWESKTVADLRMDEQPQCNGAFSSYEGDCLLYGDDNSLSESNWHNCLGRGGVSENEMPELSCEPMLFKTWGPSTVRVEF